jgi:hypothetical protein
MPLWTDITARLGIPIPKANESVVRAAFREAFEHIGQVCSEKTVTDAHAAAAAPHTGHLPLAHTDTDASTTAIHHTLGTGVNQAAQGSHTHIGLTPGAHTHIQTESHLSPDTDGAPASLHHTLGTGANQAAAGNHSHAITPPRPGMWIAAGAWALRPGGGSPQQLPHPDGSGELLLYFTASQDCFAGLVIPTTFPGGNVTMKLHWSTPSATQSCTWELTYGMAGQGDAYNPAHSTNHDGPKTVNSAGANQNTITSFTAAISVAHAGKYFRLRLSRNAGGTGEQAKVMGVEILWGP